jgi:hypothetical protein
MRVTLLRFVALAACLHGCYGTLALPLPPHLGAGGQLQFLTNAALLAACVILTTSLWWRSKWLATVALVVCNVELVVTAAYWGLMLFFPHWLNQGAFDVLVLLDLEIHLMPYVALTMQVQRHAMPLWTKSTLYTAAALAAYWTYIEYLVQSKGIRYPYPFLNGAPPITRLAWMAAFITVASGNYWVQRALYNL